ncbi:hypothetical protein [Pelagibacterium limicola]|uniref:hypothetical protein n=1 Tax=Pelagibacterium limicola TaxID=2791022 RepID=UPI0018AFFCBF|nr:hypothetical protein [Pelagibacterium limicola]
MSREWSAREIVAEIENSRLAGEINAVMALEAASEGYGLGLDERIEIIFAGGQELFGYDGAGGTYHLLSDGRILYIDSEGYAGVVARDFDDFVGITTGIPDWQTALRFMGKDTLHGARTEWTAFLVQWNVQAQQDQPWPYMPELFNTPTPRQGRKAIADYFGSPILPDAFASLYRAVNTLNADVTVSPKGELPFFAVRSGDCARVAAVQKGAMRQLGPYARRHGADTRAGIGFGSPHVRV